MTNLYLISENGNINTCPKPSEGCSPHNLHFKGASHLKSIFNDDPKKCFENAIKKKAFSETRVIDNNYDYIMYMCSNSKYDYFKSKLTKTSYRVER